MLHDEWKTDRHERDDDDEQVENVEQTATEGTLVEYDTVGDQFQTDLNGEHTREEVVELVEDLVGLGAVVDRILGG